MPAAQGLQRTLRALATTPNAAARDALLSVLEEDEVEVRVGAARALAARDDRESHEALLLEFPDCQADVRDALVRDEAVARLRKSAVAAITGREQELCEQASHYAVAADDHKLLPSIVDATIATPQPCRAELAGAALALAGSLAELIEAKRCGAEIGSHDPAFDRTAALRSLDKAVDRYREHQRPEVIEAFLLLVTYNSVMLKRVLKDASHAAHKPLIAALRTSRGYGAMDVLIHAMEDPDGSQQLLEFAGGRGDEVFVRRLLGHVGERPGVRVLHNARRLHGFAWGEPAERERLLRLEGAEQAAAMRLFAAAGTEPSDRVEIAGLLMKRGRDAGRVAACEALRRLKAPEVAGLLQIAMQDPCPGVVAAAVSQLRRHSYENGLTELVVLLDHPAGDVVAAAQRALGEFSLDSFREAYEGLTPEQRKLAGRLVAKADPDAVSEVQQGLRSPVIGRRLEALRLVGATEMTDRVLDDVLRMAEDADAGVRAEAAGALAFCKEGDPVPPLAKLLADTSAGVSQAAEEVLRELDNLEVAQGLVDALRDELTPAEEADEQGADARDDGEGADA
ncbi:MAG: HEAT repeat domain-containing protein [Planctomycetota bacterium]